MLRRFFIFLVIFGACVAFANDYCNTWFEQTGIQPLNNECPLKCAIESMGGEHFPCKNGEPLDLGRLKCIKKCDRFCKTAKIEQPFFRLSELYGHLTAAEKALIDEDPGKAYKVYKLSMTAESKCKSIYKASRTNDASDACRHYMWSGLLTKEFGPDYALRVLTAHEQYQTQADNELKMDTHNNVRGVQKAIALMEKNQMISEDSFLEEFKRAIANNELIVLKKD